MTQSDLIKTSRQILGLSQVKFAKQLNINRVTLANWEIEKSSPSPDKYRAMLELVVEHIARTQARQTFIDETVSRLNKSAEKRRKRA